MLKQVRFTQMQDGTKEDYMLLHALEQEHVKNTLPQIVQALEATADAHDGYLVTRKEHALQSATRACRDNADIDMIIGTLLHDIGDNLAPLNHASFAASVIQPYIRAEVTWIVEKHGLFQTYYYNHYFERDRFLRERFKAHKWYESCVYFCEKYDQASFDPEYDSYPIEHFMPMLEEVFNRQPWEKARTQFHEFENI